MRAYLSYRVLYSVCFYKTVCLSYQYIFDRQLQPQVIVSNLASFLIQVYIFSLYCCHIIDPYGISVHEIKRISLKYFFL